MRTALLDVRLEVRVPQDVDETGGDPAFWRQAIERMREKADEMASATGGALRTDRPPEMLSKRASHALVPGAWILMATRWHVDVPESFDADRRP